LSRCLATLSSLLQLSSSIQVASVRTYEAAVKKGGGVNEARGKEICSAPPEYKSQILFSGQPMRFHLV